MNLPGPFEVETWEPGRCVHLVQKTASFRLLVLTIAASLLFGGGVYLYFWLGPSWAFFELGFTAFNYGLMCVQALPRETRLDWERGELSTSLGPLSRTVPLKEIGHIRRGRGLGTRGRYRFSVSAVGGREGRRFDRTLFQTEWTRSDQPFLADVEGAAKGIADALGVKLEADETPRLSFP